MLHLKTNENGLPNIYDSLEIKRTDGSTLVLECQQHIGEDMKRQYLWKQLMV